ncbi:MAG: NAD-dependent epimerase/dehydratase family protein [Vicinamibacterales bacterium]
MESFVAAVPAPLVAPTLPRRPVLVTGATGFSGGHLVEALHRDGVPVRVLVRSTNRLSALPAGVEVVCGDLRAGDVRSRAVDGVSTVYHIAAAFREARLSEADYRAINVDATAALVEAAGQLGVERFVHCSTCGVHGHVEQSPANEDAPLRPGDVYQLSKLMGEQAVRDTASLHRLELVIARPTGIYGPGDRRMLKLFRSIARGRFVMLGPGNVQYHLTYIDDIVSGLRLCGEHPHAAGRTYLLAGPAPVTIRELARTIAEVMHVSLPERRLPVAPVKLLAAACELVCRPLGIEPPLHRRRVDFFVKNRAFDGSRARAELGFISQIGVSEGLRRTFESYRAQGWL